MVPVRHRRTESLARSYLGITHGTLASRRRRCLLGLHSVLSPQSSVLSPLPCSGTEVGCTPTCMLYPSTRWLPSCPPAVLGASQPMRDHQPRLNQPIRV